MGDWEKRLSKPVQHLADQLRGIRGGTVGPGLIESVRVCWSGGSAPLSKVAKVAPGRGSLVVTPFDRELVPAIVKALVEARQNAYALDPTRVSVSIPPISGEQRTEIARHVKSLGEEAKVAVRAIRQEIRKQLAATGRRRSPCARGHR